MPKEELELLLLTEAEHHRAAVEANERAAAGLNAALRDLGITSALGALDLKREPCDAAIQLLADHLPKDYPEDVTAAIAQALAIPAANRFRSLFVSLFSKEPRLKDHIRFTLAVAIARTTKSDNVSELMDLLRNRSLGPDRIGLLLYLKPRRRRPEIAHWLTELRGDPDLAPEILSWKPLTRSVPVNRGAAMLQALQGFDDANLTEEFVSHVREA